MIARILPSGEVRSLVVTTETQAVAAALSPTQLLPKTSSTPQLHEFDPFVVPYQARVLRHIRMIHDHDLGVATVLLSGSVGSAKSILCAHLIVTHALLYPGSQVMVLRKTMGDLKSTIWRVILNHYPELRQFWNRAEMKINLPNGSIIHGSSYADGNYEKFRSYELSMVVMEEATECTDKELFDQLMERLGRLPHVPENCFILATNPDGPGHWIYKTIIRPKEPNPLFKVFYSLTEQNPFLPKWYIANMRKTLDPRRAKRMLEGQWIEINDESIYYNYSTERSYRDEVYKFDPRFPIAVMFDFNVGVGKPMSAATGQHINGKFHVKKTYLIYQANTPKMLLEMANDGVFDHKNLFYIYGDQTGGHNDTRGNASDWEIIQTFLEDYRRKDGTELEFSIDVPSCNPPIKRRHNLINALCGNADGETSFFIYNEAQDADEGFRLTKLKKGSQYIEDDGPLCPTQHVTTAIGYWIDYVNEYGSGIKEQIIIS